MRLFGLIGQPLSHSFSKNYFSRKFEAEGITDCAYELFPLDDITRLPALISTHAELEGLNVTIPYKTQVLQYLNDSSHLPAGLDACNCIRIKGKSLAGYNTDTTGFQKSLDPLLKITHRHALILGNGGAARAVAYVLKSKGIDFHIVSRAIHDGSTLTYAELNEEIVSSHLLIVNTTPVGMHPDATLAPDIPYQFIGSGHLLYDLIYNPPVTAFLQKGKERGATIVNGEEMLKIQAEESWKIWNAKD
jgi:shikimate dehydrogenase